MIHEILSAEGYEVFANDGADAILPIVGVVRPDIIILDLGLPFLPGEVIVRQLWEQDHSRSIPVILSSAWHARMAELRQVADERKQPVLLLPKPYGLMDLLDVVEQAQGLVAT